MWTRKKSSLKNHVLGVRNNFFKNASIAAGQSSLTFLGSAANHLGASASQKSFDIVQKTRAPARSENPTQWHRREMERQPANPSRADLIRKRRLRRRSGIDAEGAASRAMSIPVTDHRLRRLSRSFRVRESAGRRGRRGRQRGSVERGGGSGSRSGSGRKRSTR